MIDTGHYETILRARLSELEQRLDSIEHDLDETPSADWEDRAVEREGDEVLESLGGAGLMEIRQIKAALSRIQAGEFGYCVNCGREISAERLAAAPHAARCRFCC